MYIYNRLLSSATVMRLCNLLSSKWSYPFLFPSGADDCEMVLWVGFGWQRERARWSALMQGDMNVYLRAFYRCQSLTWRQAACFCSYGSHAGNFAVREAFVSQLRGRYTSTSILKLLPFEFMLNLIHFLPHGYLVLLTVWWLTLV